MPPTLTIIKIHLMKKKIHLMQSLFPKPFLSDYNVQSKVKLFS